MKICSDPVLFIGGVGGEFLVGEVAGPCRELELLGLLLLHILEHQRELLGVWTDLETINIGSA